MIINGKIKKTKLHGCENLHSCETLHLDAYSLSPALFIITKTWKQPQWTLVGEWMNKPWYIYTIKCYST